MHYYKKNIGDYAKKAGRLSMLEHGSYTLLMDSCYDREQFPTTEEALEWTWARTDEEIEAVKFVLKRFFKLQEDGTWVQSRIKEELNAYQERAETNKRIAKEREEKRRNKNASSKKSDIKQYDVNDEARNVTKRERSVNETPPNHKPITINQEPLNKKNNKKKRKHDFLEFEFSESQLNKTSEYGLNINELLEEFKNHHQSLGNQFVDWSKAFSNWISKHIRYNKLEPIAEQRFTTDNEQWEYGNPEVFGDSYHPSHKPFESSSVVSPVKKQPEADLKDPSKYVHLNGVWFPPLPNMTTIKTMEFVVDNQQAGETKDETYKRLLEEIMVEKTA